MRITLALILALVVGFCLGKAVDARANVPSSAELSQAVSVAEKYWGGSPACGIPSITFEAMPPQDGGLAYYAECRIALTEVTDWYPAGLCRVVVHEWGHLVLGHDYFAATNPSDPAHSPDPNSIMNATGPATLATFPPCEPTPSPSAAPPVQPEVAPIEHHHPNKHAQRKRHRRRHK